MARPTEWRRTAAQFAAPGLATAHNLRPIAVFEGETVGRVHLQYQWTTFPSIPFAPWGCQGLLGVRVQDNLSTVPDLVPDDDLSDEAWMHIEGVGWKQEFGALSLQDNTPVEVISAPADGGYRDIKAMRKVTADGSIWLQDAMLTGTGNQGNHYLSYMISALIILPA